MYPILDICPVCGDELYVERMVCVQCHTAIEGTFIPQRFARLTPDQWDFVEVFMRNEGKLNRVQEELKVSYPTARGRLHDAIRGMGYEVGEHEIEEGEIHSVLDELAAGNVTVDEVLRLLKK